MAQSEDSRYLAHEIGRLLARNLAADTLTVMRADADLLAAAGNPAAAGWRLLAAALADGWAAAQSLADTIADVPPVPVIGPSLPCLRPALHTIHGFRRSDTGARYGSLDWSVSACGAHARQYRDRIAAILGDAFDNGPRPDPAGHECGRLFDFAAALGRKPGA